MREQSHIYLPVVSDEGHRHYTLGRTDQRKQTGHLSFSRVCLSGYQSIWHLVDEPLPASLSSTETQTLFPPYALKCPTHTGRHHIVALNCCKSVKIFNGYLPSEYEHILGQEPYLGTATCRSHILGETGHKKWKLDIIFSI